MADYYSLLARAVANLPKTSPPSTRRAIYERARKALTNQLRSLKPQLPESDIAREERALDEAVARLESEFEPANAEVHAFPAADAPAQAPPPPPPPPPRPEAPSFRTLAPETPALRPPTPGLRPPVAKAPPRPAPPPPPPPPAPPREPAGLPPAAPMKAPIFTAPPPEPEDGYEPPLGAPTRDGAPALGGARMEREPARPTLGGSQRRVPTTWLWVGGAVAVGFASSIAVIALLMRPALQDLSPPSPVDPPVATTTATGPDKTGNRVTPPPADPTPTPAPVASTIPDTTPAPAQTPTTAPAPSAAPSSVATVPVAGRAAILVATVADASKPAINVGNAVWSIIPAPPGQPSGIGVKAEIDIPDLKLHASMILKKNQDPNLPASHTIDLRVTFDPGSPIKGVKDIALPLMRNDDPPAFDALTGVRVKISDNYFLVGLNRADADVAKNVQLLADRGWFDFPMQLDDDRIAKLTFEKGADGEKFIAQALAAWK
jgi:hypothetical protein